MVKNRFIKISLYLILFLSAYNAEALAEEVNLNLYPDLILSLNNDAVSYTIDGDIESSYSLNVPGPIVSYNVSFEISYNEPVKVNKLQCLFESSTYTNPRLGWSGSHRINFYVYDVEENAWVQKGENISTGVKAWKRVFFDEVLCTKIKLVYNFTWGNPGYGHTSFGCYELEAWGPNPFKDIGLKVQTATTTVKVRAKYLLDDHKLRICKSGTTYGIPLVGLDSHSASPVRIYDGVSIKALPKLE